MLVGNVAGQWMVNQFNLGAAGQLVVLHCRVEVGHERVVRCKHLLA